MPSNDTALEEPSPNEDTPTPKRRRIAFSCFDCRRRKVKCDRNFPSCGRCQKGGHPDSCTYDNEAVESAVVQSSGERSHGYDLSGLNGHGAPKAVAGRLSAARSPAVEGGEDRSQRLHPEDSLARLYAQEERIRQLECRIIGLERSVHDVRSPIFSQADVKRNPEASVDEEAMIFRGKSFKTQFYGASHHTSCLSHLPELRTFMRDMSVQHQELEPARKDLRNAKIKGYGQGDQFSGDDGALFDLLPQRDIADSLVQVYVDNFESTYRVLHLPSFWEEYSTFWNAPQQGRPAFTVILLLILASSHCVKKEDSSIFRGDSSVGRETAILWIRTCDSWLQSQSKKHTNMAIFQIHCLSFIAKTINSIKRKQTWIAAGNLMRLALSSGLHRNSHIVNLRHATSTASCKSVSAFEQEMRRRIWTTISDLELQAAFDRGMPAMLRDLVEDCGPPLNVDDKEVDPLVDQLPEPRPVSEYTRSSFQHLSRLSWSLRLELLSAINGPNDQMSYERVLFYDKKIMQHLDGIPHWSEQGSLVSKVLLRLQLQAFLLVLHRPYAREEGQSSRYSYSAIMHLRSAMNILDLHNQLISTSNIFLCLFRNDIFNAALSICYNCTVSEPYSDQILFSGSSIKKFGNEPQPFVEKALSMIKDKIMCIGIGLQEYFCICAIIGLLKKQSSEHSENEEKKAAYRVQHMLCGILSMQDNYSAATTLASLPTTQMPTPTGLLVNGDSNNNGDIGVNMDGIGVNGQMNGANLLEDLDHVLDLANISEWDLETFWNF